MKHINKFYMYIILYTCMSNEHNNCDIDFEKHTQFLHVKLLHTSLISSHTYTLIHAL